MVFCSSCDSVPLKCDRAEYLGKYLSIRQKGEGLSLAVKDQTFWQTISYRVCPRLRYTLVNYRRKLPANLAQISTTGGKSTSYTVHTRVQWFWLFFTFWGITTHPWHPKGPRIWKLAKKIFQLHAWPAEIFGKNRKMRFFGLVSKFNFRRPVWQIFTIFSACFIYGILNTHIKF